MILDASALLAYLLGEAGKDVVLEAILSGAQMSVVNLAEVAARYVRAGASPGQVRALHARLPFPLLALDEGVAVEAGLMAKAGSAFGLSLGDRCCLATAKRFGMPALTADRAWEPAASVLGVEVRLIR